VRGESPPGWRVTTVPRGPLQALAATAGDCKATRAKVLLLEAGAAAVNTLCTSASAVLNSNGTNSNATGSNGAGSNGRNSGYSGVGVSHLSIPPLQSSAFEQQQQQSGAVWSSSGGGSSGYDAFDTSQVCTHCCA
jgi:hypothetical protein